MSRWYSLRLFHTSLKFTLTYVTHYNFSNLHSDMWLIKIPHILGCLLQKSPSAIGIFGKRELTSSGTTKGLYCMRTYFEILCTHVKTKMQSRQLWSVMESCHTYEWVMSHVWMRVMSHICMSHVTCMIESCHTHVWVMSHIWMSHITHMNESCHMYDWVMSHIWMSHVTHMNESCHTYEWVMSHIWMSHVTHLNEIVT